VNPLDVFFPPRCVFCGARGVRGTCASCAARLPRQPKQRREGTFGVCAVPLRYEGRAREAILRFKFRGGRGAAEGFGALLAQAAAEELGGTFEVVTWAPVSRRRERERGYDQSFLLARAACRLWDTAPARLLVKRRHTPPQSGLSAAERRANVLGAYEACAPERLQNARVLLVDDIVTSGATLTECVRVLRDAGAASVVCACLASASTEKRGNAG
jgi:ComF family protein